MQKEPKVAMSRDEFRARLIAKFAKNPKHKAKRPAKSAFSHGQSPPRRAGAIPCHHRGD